MTGAGDAFIPLPEEETRSLLAAAQHGDFGAKERLSTVNSRLVRSIARRFAINGRDIDDLYQVGCIGLLKAINRFDFKYDVCFSTYAVHLIMGEIRRYLRDDNPLSVSRSLKDRARLLETKRKQLQDQWGEDPELWQLAEACSCSEEEALIAIEATRPPLSINEVRYKNDSSSAPIGELLPDQKTEFAEHVLDSISLQELISKLPDKLQMVIRCRYFEDITQSEIASRLGVSQVQVSRLEKQALARIRREMYKEEVS